MDGRGWLADWCCGLEAREATGDRAAVKDAETMVAFAKRKLSAKRASEIEARFNELLAEEEDKLLRSVKSESSEELGVPNSATSVEANTQQGQPDFSEQDIGRDLAEIGGSDPSLPLSQLGDDEYSNSLFEGIADSFTCSKEQDEELNMSLGQELKEGLYQLQAPFESTVASGISNSSLLAEADKSHLSNIQDVYVEFLDPALKAWYATKKIETSVELLHTGIDACYKGDIVLSKKIFCQCIADCVEYDEGNVLPRAAANLANVFEISGEHELAARVYVVALGLVRRQGDIARERLLLTNAFTTLLRLNRLHDAREACVRQIAILEQLVDLGGGTKQPSVASNALKEAQRWVALLDEAIASDVHAPVQLENANVRNWYTIRASRA